MRPHRYTAGYSNHLNLLPSERDARVKNINALRTACNNSERLLQQNGDADAMDVNSVWKKETHAEHVAERIVVLYIFVG